MLQPVLVACATIILSATNSFLLDGSLLVLQNLTQHFAHLPRLLQLLPRHPRMSQLEAWNQVFAVECFAGTPPLLQLLGLFLLESDEGLSILGQAGKMECRQDKEFMQKSLEQRVLPSLANVVAFLNRKWKETGELAGDEQTREWVLDTIATPMLQSLPALLLRVVQLYSHSTNVVMLSFEIMQNSRYCIETVAKDVALSTKWIMTLLAAAHHTDLLIANGARNAVSAILNNLYLSLLFPSFSFSFLFLVILLFLVVDFDVN